MNWNRILLIISMFLMSVCCFAQKKADKLYLEGQELQKVMTIESQENAIKKFKSAKAIYKSEERKNMCDNQVEVCKRNISQLKPTVVVHKPAVVVHKPKQSNTLDLGYAIYTGGIRKGKPDGVGKMKFKKSHRIDSNIVAQSGDVFDGSYTNGHIDEGKLIRSNGEVITIIGEN